MRIEVAAEIAVHFLQLLMRQFQEAVDQAEFVHHLKRRRMHGIAAKIPKEIGMFFQHQRVDAGPPQQISQHHPGRPAADDATPRVTLGWSFRGSGRVHDPALVDWALSAGSF